MKTILFLTIIFFNINCKQDKFLITQNSIGYYKIGETLQGFDNKDFDIKIDKNKRITSIIVSSESYKTPDGFGVGSSTKDMKKFYGKDLNIKPFALSKGSIKISNKSRIIVINDISFILFNDDEIVDAVWIHKK